METLKLKLYELLKEEIFSLELGHPFNRKRLKEMRELCRILECYEYLEPSISDVAKIINFYEYN